MIGRGRSVRVGSYWAHCDWAVTIELDDGPLTQRCVYPAHGPELEHRLEWPAAVVIEFPNRHTIKAVEVVIECECGDLFSGDTEQHAIFDWEVHVQDEADP